ncbi:hypothetical protein IHE55_18170 [Streptomyces pactum]|uniref:Secreted protein n=2 Tax=Streptomyces pactum TaxID=68249 RepID=A0ABS0NN09_9ACTN|nr:hypothetical protein [Streptomyces pactum]
MSHAQPPQKRQNWFARHKVLTGIGAVVVVAAIGTAAAGGGGDDKDSKDRTTQSAGKDSGGGSGKGTEKKEEKAEPAIDGDGTFEVGSDVKPGTYRTTGNDELGGCYWERAKDSSGEMDSILANDNVTGASYVTIKPTDKIFKSNGCNDWEAVPDKPAAGGTPKTEFSGKGGMYRVGVDIAPGTYKSAGNDGDIGCYWERDKDALHGLESIAANENVTGSGVVTIAPGDAYFKTNNCNDWKKAG